MIFFSSIYRRGDDLRGEEQKLRSANDRSLQEMRQRLERELEEAKLELLEVFLCKNSKT